MTQGAARPDPPFWRIVVVSGMASCFSEACTLPMDTVKVQGQAAGQQYTGLVDAFGKILRSEGVAGLMKGLSPALLRQATYGSSRLGMYGPIKRQFGFVEGAPFPVYKKVGAGMCCGAFASGIFNPCDVIKVRMQADVAGLRYRGLVDAFRTIVAEEGVRGLYVGVTPTVQRAAIVAAAELATYDVFKTMLIERAWADNIMTHTVSSLAAGFVACLVSSPADVIKSRVMSQPLNSDGTPKFYKGTFDCLSKSIKNDGVFSLWKGFWPNYLRLGPNVVLLFVSFEQFSNLARWAKFI